MTHATGPLHERVLAKLGGELGDHKIGDLAKLFQTRAGSTSNAMTYLCSLGLAEKSSRGMYRATQAGQRQVAVQAGARSSALTLTDIVLDPILMDCIDTLDANQYDGVSIDDAHQAALFCLPDTTIAQIQSTFAVLLAQKAIEISPDGGRYYITRGGKPLAKMVDDYRAEQSRLADLPPPLTGIPPTETLQ